MTKSKPPHWFEILVGVPLAILGIALFVLLLSLMTVAIMDCWRYITG